MSFSGLFESYKIAKSFFIFYPTLRRSVEGWRGIDVMLPGSYFLYAGHYLRLRAFEPIRVVKEHLFFFYSI